jgi:demethylmenaquinone methyltransferase/2-methoxy-6-polyprenyl-1,4-benzoquinol methylase
MLALARAKHEQSPYAAGRAATAGATLRFEAANALSLPYPDDEFDAATVGFGARNFSDLEQGLREMARVVKPGGRVVILEITNPQRPPLSTFFELWFDRLIPALGHLAGDAQAYSYLPSSVRRFPGPEALAAVMLRCGLIRIRYLITAGGIIALHVGEVVAVAVGEVGGVAVGEVGAAGEVVPAATCEPDGAERARAR